MPVNRKKAAENVGKPVGPGPEDSFKRAEAIALREIRRTHMDAQGFFYRNAMTSPFSSVRVQATLRISDPSLIPALQFAPNSDVSNLGKHKTEVLPRPPLFRKKEIDNSEIEKAGMDQHKLLDIALTAKDSQTRVTAAEGIVQPDLIPSLMASDCEAVREIGHMKLAGRKRL